MSLIAAMEREVEVVRKQAQMASMEQVTRLRDELARERALSQQRLKALQGKIREVEFCRRDQARKGDALLDVIMDLNEVKAREVELQKTNDSLRHAIKMLSAEYQRQIRTLTNHIATMSGVPRVVIDLSRKCPETKSECRERYINGGLPADVNEWMRNCDMQKAPSLDIRGPSC